MKRPQIVIVGGGPAGLGAASAIDLEKNDVMLIEQEEKLGGKLNQWHLINPTFSSAAQMVDKMAVSAQQPQIILKTSTKVDQIKRDRNNQLHIVTDKQTEYVADCVIFAGGYQLFDAKKKEELGYGIYPRVVTSADVERMLAGKTHWNADLGTSPRIGIVHCVGSRDAKCGNRHCSRMCCMTGVKQAIELKRRYPQARIWNFYMDLRMFGRGYEELYLQAQQEYGIQFVRGRVSEVAENKEKRLMVKAEDTLMGKPLRGEFDLLVLLVGMEPLKDVPFQTNGETGSDGFVNDPLEVSSRNTNPQSGIFWAGACKGPTSSAEAFKDGQSAGLSAMDYLKTVE